MSDAEIKGADSAAEETQEITSETVEVMEKPSEVETDQVVTSEAETEAAPDTSEENPEETPEASDDPETESVSDTTDTPDTSEIPKMTRKPYHERYYMLYGGESVPETIDPGAALEFLKGIGFGNNPLQQARSGKDMSALIEGSVYENASNRHFCDFCGVQLTGVEYEVLKDGRERCTTCTRTAVKTEEQFVIMFSEIISNMELFFNIRIKQDIKVRMVNARTLHRELGKSFVPTGEQDPRILGVGIKDNNNRHTIMVENGAPRMEAIKTMVHELTHIWQFQNWNENKIRELYGDHQVIQIYEGMAKWVEVQYCFLLGESGVAKREELLLMNRGDEYGLGFMKYCSVYPLSYDSETDAPSPFDNLEHPL